MAGIALCHEPRTTLVFVVLSAAGFGAMTPISADMLRNCYPPAVRSKVFSILQIATQFTIMVGTLSLGKWLDLDVEAFLIEVPKTITDLMARDRDLALDWRRQTRKLFQEYFEKGYRVEALHRGEASAFYRLAREQDASD